MRALAPTFVLCAVLTCANAYAQEGGLPSFSGMALITWDSHVHSGNSQMFACLTDPGYDPAVPCHSHRWCEDAYQEAKARGLKALVLSHHAYSLEYSLGLTAWIANAGGYTDAHGNFWPTHADGYPLLVSGGHTTDEVDALWECAEANSTPGEFLAFYGIEYTASSPVQPGCDILGQPGCGGHKVGIFGTRPEISCATRLGGGSEQRCENEGELYDALDLYSDASNPSVASTAHPASETWGADFKRYHERWAQGGISQAHIVGYELTGASTEDLPCVNDPPASAPRTRCGYRQVLALGYRVAPWWGSDNHLTPESWDYWIIGPTTSATGICLASDFTKSSFLQAIEQRRCYVARFGGEPLVQLEIEGAQMGQAVLPSGDLDYALYIDKNGADAGYYWEIGCGEVTFDGGNGNYAPQANGSCSDEICEATGSFAAGSFDWCYLRTSVVEGGAYTVVTTAPVFFVGSVPTVPTMSSWGLASSAMLMVVLRAVILGVSRRRVLDEDPSARAR